MSEFSVHAISLITSKQQILSNLRNYLMLKCYKVDRQFHGSRDTSQSSIFETLCELKLKDILLTFSFYKFSRTMLSRRKVKDLVCDKYYSL